MPQVSQLSPELARGLLLLARALVTGIRSWTLYPPDHPAVAQSHDRLCEAIRQTAGDAIFSIGVTPDTLIIEGGPADLTQPVIAEAAALLHDHDVLQITFLGKVPRAAVRSLLQMLALDSQERRKRGGPAQMWIVDGHPSIAIEQIDYQKLLEREEGASPEGARRDDLWQSIVASIVSCQSGVFDEHSQKRLLAISENAADIADLATAVGASRCTADGSPMITSQAATVLAAFRHLTSIVTAASPERVPAIMGNLAAAAAQLDPRVVMQLLNTVEDPDDRLQVVTGVRAAFDDVKVAQLLATALAIDGQASDRLATIFNTIVPDEDRKRRVLTLTRTLLNESDFGRANHFQALWTSMEELLVSYDDKAFVSDSYRASLDGAGGRAERMAATDLPPELPSWLDTLGQDNVRSLSVTLLIDLLSLEQDATRAADIARDLEALAEDLLLSGSYDDALTVTKALTRRAAASGAIGRDACRRALDDLGESPAMRETATLIGDLDANGWSTLEAVITTVGASSVEALKAVVAVEHETDSSRRAETLIVGFGPLSAARLASLAGDSRWFAQRAAARILGRIGLPVSVPLLQPLLRRTDPRVAREAVAALAVIDDPSAARAIHLVLRSATGALRIAVIDALVADRDPRVVPMLARIIGESEPLGADHQVVLETLEALGAVGSDDAIPAIVKMIARRGFFGRRKLRALKETGVAALVAIGSQTATAALEEAANTGDGMLKKIAQLRIRN
jgi:HEAT repeat protein